MIKKGRRRDKFGVLVFKGIVSKEILIWKHIESEKIKDYTYLKDELITMGFTVNGIVIDGKRGLFKAFDGFPNVSLPSKDDHTTLCNT